MSAVFGQQLARLNELADLINVAIEELVRQKFELPGFTRLVRSARRVRKLMARTLYRQIKAGLDELACKRIDALLESEKLPGETTAGNR